MLGDTGAAVIRFGLSLTPCAGCQGVAVAELVRPDIVVYVCQSCVSEDEHVPRQWDQNGARILVREIPCSGKIDAQYLFRVLEAGGQGFCIVTCPPGQCSLGQGNYRADVRIRMVRRLLAEIGLEPERAEILHCASDGRPEDGGERLGEVLRRAVRRLCALGESPLRRADAVGRSSA